MSISPLVIKINNFSLYGSISCIVPYMGVYFLHYTDGTEENLGQLTLLASLVGIIFTTTLGSVADRYQVHRGVYLFTLTLAFLSFISLLAPIYLRDETDQLVVIGQNQSLDERQQVASREINIGDTTIESFNDNQPRISSKIWQCLISFCIFVGSMSTTVNMCLSDTFTVNLAPKCNISYGSIRLWGSIGWIFCSLILSYLNKVFECKFLVPSLLLYAILATSNLLLVLFWPDRRPFDLAEEGATLQEGTEFQFNSKFRISTRTVADCKNDLFTITPDSWTTPRSRQVSLTKAQVRHPFDTRDEDLFRNIRRCSLAPLGDTFLIKQFELDEKSAKHFNHVTKIEPRNGISEQVSSLDYRMNGNDNSRLVLDTTINGQAKIINGNSTFFETTTNENPFYKEKKKMGFKLHLTIIRMIAMRHKIVIRVLILFIVEGSLSAMNLIYLFPYLDSLDSIKFNSLSAFVMTISCGSVALFYQLSPYFTKSLTHAQGLSAIFYTYGLRFGLYLLFNQNEITLPIELIVLVELLHGPTAGWFDCVFNEASLEFALKANECVPELIKLGYIDDTKESIEMVKNGIKGTMISISSACTDGIGLAFGSLAGGLVIEHYGYNTLWVISSSLAILFGTINLAIELKNR